MARVGVDIDGVLYPFDEELKKALLQNGKRFYDYELPPPTKWEFFEDWRMTRECFVDYCNEYTNSGELFRYGQPYFGVVEELWRLREAGHTIVLITNRNFGDEGVVEDSTRYWLDHWAFPFDELHFVKDKTEIDVDYHIDDNVDNCRAMAGAGVKVSLCDQPWNRETAAIDIGCRRDSLETFVGNVLAREGDGGAAAPEGVIGQHAQLDPHEEERVSRECGLEPTEIPPFPDSTLTLPQGEVRVTSSTGGQKGKKEARFDLIPAEALWEVAVLYGKGAEKYDDWNWRKGYAWSLSIAAMMRHLFLFLRGQDYDEETGCHHLTAVIFHAMTLLVFRKEHPEFDDRYSTTSD